MLSYGNYNWYKRTGNPVPEGETSSMLTNAIPTSPLGATQLWRKDGWSNANGITAEIERRYSKGVGFQLFYQLVNAAAPRAKVGVLQRICPTLTPPANCHPIATRA